MEMTFPRSSHFLAGSPGGLCSQTPSGPSLQQTAISGDSFALGALGKLTYRQVPGSSVLVEGGVQNFPQSTWVPHAHDS